MASNPLVGTWRLIRWYNVSDDGETTYPLGKEATGYLSKIGSCIESKQLEIGSTGLTFKFGCFEIKEWHQGNTRRRKGKRAVPVIVFWRVNWLSRSRQVLTESHILSEEVIVGKNLQKNMVVKTEGPDSRRHLGARSEGFFLANSPITSLQPTFVLDISTADMIDYGKPATNIFR